MEFEFWRVQINEDKIYKKNFSMIQRESFGVIPHVKTKIIR